MRIGHFFLAVAVLVVSAFQAMAASNSDLQDCNQRTDYDRQIAGCSRALSWMKPPDERARLHTLRGMALTNKEEFNRAIEDYDQAIRLDPQYLWSWLNRAEAWYRKGDAARAFSDLEEAARLDPNNSRVYSVRASTWWPTGDLDRALADYSEAICLEPNFSVFYNSRALVWRDKGDYDKAIADYDEAIRRDPRDVRAYANRGEIWRLKGDLDRALADQDKQVRISPRNPNSYLTRGDTFRYRGEFERALADDDRTLLLERDSIAAYTGRGLTFERLENRTRAYAEFEKALASRSQNRSDYLVPVDATLAVDRDIEYEAVPLSQVLRATDAAKRIKLVMLDACRDNPFAPRKTAAPEAVVRTSTAGAPIASRSTNGRGLAEVKVAGATLVVFAAKDGQVALDGEGGNSPFAVAWFNASPRRESRSTRCSASSAMT